MPKSGLGITNKIISVIKKTTIQPGDFINDTELGNNINISFEGTSGNNIIDVDNGQFLIVSGDSSGVDISGVNPNNLSGVKELVRFDGDLITSAKLTCSENINVSGDINFPNTIITEDQIYNQDDGPLHFNNIGSGGILSCNQFIGNHTGNVIGDVSGDIVGNVIGDLSGIIGLSTQNVITGTSIHANTNFIGNFIGNASGNVVGNLTGDVGNVNSRNIVSGSTITATDTFIGNLSGTASSVKDGIYSTSSVTELSDIDLSGSGKIITDAERLKLNDISDNANLYILPNASGNILGGVKIPDSSGNITIDNSGSISTPSYTPGTNINLTGTTFSVKTNDLSDNVLMRSNNQDMSGVKTFNETIVGNISGNATTATLSISTSSVVTDLSGMINTGSGKIITDTERAVINNLSGIDTTANYTELPIASANVSGGIIVGDTLSINNGLLNNITYYQGNGLNLTGTTFSVNTSDLSDNVLTRSNNQNINDVKTFNETIIGNISGNATTATDAITTSSPVTDLSGMTHSGSGKIITNTERNVINNLSGIDISANYTELPIASVNVSGGIIVGSGLTIGATGVLSVSASHTSYNNGYGINLSGTTLSVNTNDLSDNVLMSSGNQTIGGVTTFGENIIGNISGNATTATGAITTSSEVTDLSGMTHSGSNNIITNAERSVINDLSGIDLSANYTELPIASANVSGGIIVGSGLTIDASGVLNVTGGSTTYESGYGLNLSGTTFSVNTGDLSNNILMRSGNQNINDVKTFGENIIGNISGNATTATGAITSSSEVTDLSGMTDTGSGRIITNTERSVINNLSGIVLNANYTELPIATTTISGGIIVGSGLTIDASGVLNVTGGSASYQSGYGLNLSGTTFIANTNDLSNNILMRSGNQNINDVKTFNETIIGNISGNATTATGAITSSSEVTDLSGMTHTGSGRIITNTERSVINNLSGIDLSANYTELPIASTTISGGIIVGSGLTIDASGVLNISGSSTSYTNGYGLNLSGTTFSVNTSDLSDNVLMRSGNQNISGIKTFGENIIGNISGNATSATLAITSSSEVTDLSGMTHSGSGKIITDAERTVIYDLSGSTSEYNYVLPTASGDVLGGINVSGDNIFKITGDVLDLSGDINTPVATNSTLGGAKLSTNIDISNNEFIDTIIPKFYADFSGNTNTSSPYIFSTNSTALTHTGHTLTFYKPPNTLISAKWSGVYNVTGSDRDEYMLNFRIKINKDSGGVLDNSGVSMSAGYQAWGLEGTTGNGTRSGALNGSSITLPNQLTDTSDNILASGNTDISVWLQGYGSAMLTATGGTITNYTIGGVKYIVHTFTGTGTSNFETVSNINCDFIIIGGGGGGGGVAGGGGGAGGVVIGTDQTITSGTHTVVVGAGGPGSTSTGYSMSSSTNANGTNGNNSTFFNYSGIGGGGGCGCGFTDISVSGSNGGSGGGGQRGGVGGSGNQNTYSSTTGVTGYGNDGGDGPGTAYNDGGFWAFSGGGGGAAAAGQLQGDGGAGGIGIQNSFRTGSNIYYAGGGAGGKCYNSNATRSGGTGGGGASNQSLTTSDRDGTINTGGGGGGAADPNYTNATLRTGGSGGSGIVVIRYTESQVLSVPPETLNVSSSMLSAWVYPA